jgi:hypothetical protein
VLDVPEYLLWLGIWLGVVAWAVATWGPKLQDILPVLIWAGILSLALVAVTQIAPRPATIVPFTTASSLLLLVGFGTLAATRGRTGRSLILRLLILVVLVVALWKLIEFGYSARWTGFGEQTIKEGTNENVQRAKTFWDWLQLLGIPAMLAAGVYWLNRLENRRVQS